MLEMCDALSRNKPKEAETDLCNCLGHARRNFVDQIENFPEECRRVIESIRQIYHHDAKTKELKLTDAARLTFHQEHSLPVIGAAPGTENAWFAFGHGHVGMCGGASTGREIAHLVAGRPTEVDLNPFRADRF